MPNTREKLIELLEQINGCCPKEGDCYHCKYEPLDDCSVYAKADFLIANGVTVQQWIPANEPPKENGYYLCWILFSAVGEYKEYRQKILFWEDNMWLESARSFRKEYPTHWMPLPTPPKP